MTGRRALLWAAQLALLGVIGWLVYRSVAGQLATLRWADVLAVGRPAAGTLLLSLALLVAFYLLHAALWRRILADLEGGRPGARDTLQVYFVSALGRYVPGKLWQLAGMALLARRAELAPARSAAAAVLGQIGFLSTGLLFLGLLLPEWRDALPEGSAAGALDPLTLAAALLGISAIALWLVVATPLGHAARATAARRLGQRMGERLGSALALADLIRPHRALLWGAGYALSWVLLGAAFVAFVAAFEPTALEHVRKTAGTVAASYLIGYLFIIAPAGAVVREAAMFALLGQFLPTAAALVIPVLSRLWFTAAELLPLAAIPLLPQRPHPVPNGAP
ncbi:MAG TPA: lysylphosphatidylglycerol synthase domain-containing protein [Longimicrobiales bacterium]|nr:lysylphosphatidylglycerol synthase domain-containing protein [Longimicrobiales bacterium]